MRKSIVRVGILVTILSISMNPREYSLVTAQGDAPPCDMNVPALQNLKVTPPAADIDPEIASWSGAWHGAFGGARPTLLVVEQVGPTSMSVAYSVAPLNEGGAGFRTRSQATIAGPGQIQFSAAAASLLFTMAPSQAALDGEFSLNGNVSPISLTRCSLPVSTSVVSSGASPDTFESDFRDKRAGFPDPFEGNSYLFFYNQDEGYYAAEHRGGGGFYHAARPGVMADVDAEAVVRIDAETPAPGARAALGVRNISGTQGIVLMVNPTTGSAQLNELQFSNGQYTGMRGLGNPVPVGRAPEYRMRLIARGEQLEAKVNDLPVAQVTTGVTAPGVITLGVQSMGPNRARMLFSYVRVGPPGAE